MNEKQCDKCLLFKSEIEFYQERKGCKKCYLQCQRDFKALRGNEYKNLCLESPETQRKCRECGNFKSILEFSGYWGNCRKCCSALSLTRIRKRKEKNREKFLKKRRGYYRKGVEQALLRSSRWRAKKHNLPHDITKDDCIIPEFCPVLGIKLECAIGQPNDNSPSLDKIVPELGYVKGNVQVVSYRANSLKRDGTLSELKKIVQYMEKYGCQ